MSDVVKFNNHHSNVVSTPLLLSRLDEEGSCLLVFQIVLEIGGNQGVGEFFRKTIGTQQQAIPRLHIQRLDIHGLQVLAAQALRQHMTPGMHPSLLWSNISRLHGLCYPGGGGGGGRGGGGAGAGGAGGAGGGGRGRRRAGRRRGGG